MLLATRQYIPTHINASFLYRGIALFALLLVFATGLKAQRYYVIYYEEGVTRHYLAISEDGNSLTNETELSRRCYWMTDNEFNTALEVIKNKKQTPNSPVNTYNESSRKALRSFAFPGKYLLQNSAHGDKQYETGQKLQLGTTASIRWLMDNDDANSPVLYYYYYKHYVYYDNDNGWQYSTLGYQHANKVKIEAYSVFPPQLSVARNGDSYHVSISAQDRCTIYYTTDGSTPTTASSPYDGVFSASKGGIIKAIAYDGMLTSSVAEMILPESMTVKLNDCEDHNWTYYSGVNTSVDNVNYNSKYKGFIYSPNPCDVKITYDGNGGAVSISEPETSFVYYKTLECKTVGTGDEAVNTYPYTVISNPFSKRPTGKGFEGWKIIKGGEYIQNYNNGDILPLDEEIVFTGFSIDSENPIEIEFKANWIDAHITRLTSLTGTLNVSENKYMNDYTYEKEGGTYETNFLVLNFNPTSITVKSPCTILMAEPDGSIDYRGNYTFTGYIIPMADGNTKIESVHWKPTATIDAKGRNFTIGRGMKMDGTKQHIFGSASPSDNVNQTLKVESGRFFQLRHYAENGDYGDRVTRQWVTLGCDYDRAKGDNTKLEFTGSMYVGHYCTLNLSHTEEMCRVYGLSGKFCTSRSIGTASYTDSYYMSVSDAYNQGHRYLEIQGGEWLNIAGGTNNYTPSPPSANYSNGLDQQRSFTFRMKGGLVKGSIYGGAEFYDAVGTRTYVITGGTIKGWVAGGANGTKTNGGQLYGNSYLYVGGNARVDSNPDSNESSNTIINRAVGGNVFGAGCGYDATSTSGQVTLGTNVVIADNAYVERGVYGGGSYGFCSTDKTSYIYITGGTVDGKAGGVDGTNYMDNIQGGIYGGACQNKGGNVNIYMTGGTVNGGIYGGSNNSGTLSGNVNIKITGGKVGESSQKTASVYGGGYGNGTTVNGDTNISMTNGTVNGNLFGGGNQGIVNNNTTVTITGGTVTGNVYGGGNQAEVSGTTKVVIGSSGQ